MTAAGLCAERTNGDKACPAAEERVKDGEEKAAATLDGMEAGTGDALCMLRGLPRGTRTSTMEIVDTSKAPSFTYKLGNA